MKTFAITIINFLRAPRVLIAILVWGKKNNISIGFKRLNNIVLILNLTVNNSRLKIEVGKLVSIIFEIDKYIDSLNIKDKGFQKKVKTLLKMSRFKELIKGSFQNSGSEYYQSILSRLENLIKSDLTAQLTNDPDIYLRYAKFSIGYYCIATILCLNLKQNYNETFVSNSSLLIRIMSDISTYKKDIDEERKNILLWKST